MKTLSFQGNRFCSLLLHEPCEVALFGLADAVFERFSSIIPTAARLIAFPPVRRDSEPDDGLRRIPPINPRGKRCGPCGKRNRSAETGCLSRLPACLACVRISAGREKSHPGPIGSDSREAYIRISSNPFLGHADLPDRLFEKGTLHEHQADRKPLVPFSARQAALPHRHGGDARATS